MVISSSAIDGVLPTPRDPLGGPARKNLGGGGPSLANPSAWRTGEEIVAPRCAPTVVATAPSAAPNTTFSAPQEAERKLGSQPDPEKPRFDLLTLREWFNEVDKDRNGHVTKVEWLGFLQFHPQIRALVLSISPQQRAADGGTAVDEPPRSEASKKETEAKHMRRLLRIWTDIDKDKNGTLEWNEFVELFRRGGFLLEYAEKNNPKERLASILGEMHESPAKQDEAELDEFMQLRNQHLDGERRRSLGASEALDAIDTIAQEEQTVEATRSGSESFRGRRTSLAKIAGGVPTSDEPTSPTSQPRSSLSLAEPSKRGGRRSSGLQRTGLQLSS